MNFSQAFKVFQLNILRQSGIAVTPQQLGLKSDPIADLQAKNALGGPGSFGNILNRVGNTATGNPPAPPTPPADPADLAAQAKYQQDLLTYNNQFQVYNQRMYQLMMQQMQAMHQALLASQKQQNQSASPERAIGVGGILSGLDS